MLWIGSIYFAYLFALGFYAMLGNVDESTIIQENIQIGIIALMGLNLIVTSSLLLITPVGFLISDRVSQYILKNIKKLLLTFLVSIVLIFLSYKAFILIGALEL